MLQSSNKKLPHLFIAAGFILVSLLLLSIIALWKLNNEHGLVFESELQKYQAQQQAIVRILNAAYQRALSLHNMTITQDPFAKDATFLKFRDFGQRLIADREYLSSTNTTEQEWQIWRQIRDTLNNGGSLQYQIIDTMDAGDNAAAQELLVNRLQPLQEHLQEQLHKLSKTKEAKLFRRQSIMQSRDSNIKALMYVLGLVAAILGIATYISIRRSTNAEIALVKQAEHYKDLYQQSALVELSGEDQIRETIQLLCRYLDMDAAKLSKVDIRRRSLTYVEIVDLSGSLTAMEKSNVVSLDKTMSGLCVEKSDPIVLQHVAQSIYANSEFYELSNTGSFVGIGLKVDGQVYGSLSFFRHQARNSAFSPYEIEALVLASQWISVILQTETALKLQIEDKVNQQSSNFETRFYANINHELRTPLNAIIGYSELLLRGEQTTEEKGDEVLRKIRQSGHHLLSLVDNILDLTRLEAGKVNLSVQEFDVMASVNAVLESLDYLFLQTGSNFICRHYLGTMQTDKEKFQQILQNLIENICQYSKQSELTMNITECRQDGREFVKFSLSGNIGMQNLASKLIDIVNESVRRHWDYGRMELGFSLCHRFTQILGGSLSVSEHSGQAPVFQLMLPKRLQAGVSMANVG